VELPEDRSHIHELKPIPQLAEVTLTNCQVECKEAEVAMDVAR
jgi:hypothetical protein